MAELLLSHAVSSSVVQAAIKRSSSFVRRTAVKYQQAALMSFTCTQNHSGSVGIFTL